MSKNKIYFHDLGSCREVYEVEIVSRVKTGKPFQSKVKVVRGLTPKSTKPKGEIIKCDFHAFEDDATDENLKKVAAMVTLGKLK